MMIVNPERAMTPRQLELLALYASGHDLRSISEIKFISYSAVKQNLAAAKDRVGARSLSHLCAICVEWRVIAPDGSGGYRPVQEERVVGE